MIAPELDSLNAGRKALVARTAERKLMFNESTHSSSGIAELPPRNARIVYEVVDSTKSLESIGCEGFDASLGPNITRNEGCIGRGLFMKRAGRYYDRCSAIDQPLRDGSADFT